MEPCKGCGRTDEFLLPWGWCGDCTATLVDMSRKSEHRLNPPEVLEKQLEKIRAYAEGRVNA